MKKCKCGYNLEKGMTRCGSTCRFKIKRCALNGCYKDINKNYLLCDHHYDKHTRLSGKNNGYNCLDWYATFQ